MEQQSLRQFLIVGRFGRHGATKPAFATQVDNQLSKGGQVSLDFQSNRSIGLVVALIGIAALHSPEAAALVSTEASRLRTLETFNA